MVRSSRRGNPQSQVVEREATRPGSDGGNHTRRTKKLRDPPERHYTLDEARRIIDEERRFVFRTPRRGGRGYGSKQWGQRPDGYMPKRCFSGLRWTSWI